jgi:hypothetical protein
MASSGWRLGASCRLAASTVAGCPVSFAASEWNQSLLYGVQPFDSKAISGTPVLLISPGSAAAMAPAARAMRPDRLPVRFGASLGGQGALFHKLRTTGQMDTRQATGARKCSLPGADPLAASAHFERVPARPEGARIPSEERRRRNSKRVQARHSHHRTSAGEGISPSWALAVPFRTSSPSPLFEFTGCAIRGRQIGIPRDGSGSGLRVRRQSLENTALGASTFVKPYLSRWFAFWQICGIIIQS